MELLFLDQFLVYLERLTVHCGCRSTAAEIGNKSCSIVTFRLIAVPMPAARSVGKPGLKKFPAKVGLRTEGSRFRSRIGQIYTAAGANCGIPATGSKDYRIGSVIALELANPFR